MDFLGIKVNSHGVFNGKDDWRQIPEHVFCPLDTVEKQMECKEYKPIKAGDWQCVFCDGDWCLK
jgi:hypothetical protein